MEKLRVLDKDFLSRNDGEICDWDTDVPRCDIDEVKEEENERD